MGKKDKKKNPAKKFALQAKKEAKADKKAQKRLQKQDRQRNGGDDDDDDEDSRKDHAGPTTKLTSGGGRTNDDDNNNIDALLESYRKQNLESTTPIVEVLDGSGSSSTFPYPPRGNFTLTACPTTGDIVMIGGEYFNGVENVVFDEVLSWNPDAKLPSVTSSSNHDTDSDTNDDDTNNNKPSQGVWKRILAPSPTPPARCSHTTVFYNDALYILAGELANADHYHHYKDLWKFNLKTNLWTELKPSPSAGGGTPGPSPRSGHRALVWRHYMIVFGGFFEAARVAPRWYNDLHVFDFATGRWMDCCRANRGIGGGKSTTLSLAVAPPERSAFNFGLVGDVAYLYGGYSKLTNPKPGTKAEGLIHDDCWALHLKNTLERNVAPTWEKVYGGSARGSGGGGRRKNTMGEYPSPRSGTACVTWKNKLLVYGGVQDEEEENHRMQSVFYDDLFSFDMELKRWFQLKLKKEKKIGVASGRRRRKKKGDSGNGEGEEAIDTKVDDLEVDEEDDESEEEEENETVEGEANSSGWDLDKLRSNMFAFIDGDGNIVYEKIEPENADNANGTPDDEKKMAAKSAAPVVTECESKEKGEDGTIAVAHCGDDTDDITENASNSIRGNVEEKTQKDDDVVMKDYRKSDHDTNATTHGDKDAKTVETAKVHQPSLSNHNNTNTNTNIIPTKQSKVMVIDENTKTPQAIRPQTPLPRINSQIVVRGSTMYIYGGILEVGDREVTLDDCWSIDLHRRTEWVCVWPGTMHRQVWKGSLEESDTESFISTDRDANAGGEDSDDDFDEFGEFDDIAEDGHDNEEAIAAAKNARRAEKKAAKKEKIRGIREEIKSLNERLDLHGGVGADDTGTTTPQRGEELADFYARTAEFWEARAAETVVATATSVASSHSDTSSGGHMSTKELKRVGFNMAKLRYDELKPVLDRLNELEGTQQENEERKLKKAKKKDKKDKSKSRRK